MDDTHTTLDPARYPELIEAGPEHDHLPLVERTLESLMASGLEEDRARFILAIENGEIDLNEPGREY
ncbi:MAG: hypothetical protein JNK72_00315 [Myxococcales bacterium]|nr:hypothetical protein [Myxococcales bacterium]